MRCTGDGRYVFEEADRIDIETVMAQGFEELVDSFALAYRQKCSQRLCSLTVNYFDTRGEIEDGPMYETPQTGQTHKEDLDAPVTRVEISCDQQRCLEGLNSGSPGMNLRMFSLAEKCVEAKKQAATAAEEVILTVRSKLNDEMQSITNQAPSLRQ